MAEVRLSATARAQILDILIDGELKHGEAARRRYAALVQAALQDLADDPFRPSARRNAVGGAVLLTYHLGLSRQRVPNPPGRVGKPVHALVYDVTDGIVHVLGLIHERMHPGRRLRRLKALYEQELSEDPAGAD